MTSRTRDTRRIVIAVLGTFAVLAGFLTALAPTTSPTASAADARNFQDGYIISDANFFASTSMDPGSIQSFLNARVPTCRGKDGVPCLKDYSQSTPVVAADAYCGRFPGGTMTGAQIIAAVAQACGISPKVLIVMLQKEQRLITDTTPVEWSYKAAMGQACPDNAPCDPNYAGFFYQVYGGARQMQKYVKRPEWWGYQLGWNNIQWDVEVSCGTKRVNILNNATRALYIYTPYTPNTAALDNLYGLGDGCSSYGNRNFWRLYTDWFGDPVVSGADQIGAAYAANGGRTGWLGVSLSGVICNSGTPTCYQWFQNGLIMYSPDTGAQAMSRPIHSAWVAQGYENGWMGYPLTSTICNSGTPTCYQWFQNGLIMYSPDTGAQAMSRPIHSAWVAQGYENGWMGYPTSSVQSAPDGSSSQTFQHGVIRVSVDGTVTVSAS